VTTSQVAAPRARWVSFQSAQGGQFSTGAHTPSSQKEDLYSELAPAGGAEPRRIGALPPLATALAAVLGGRPQRRVVDAIAEAMSSAFIAVSLD
jgi:hypothetical protein